MPFRLSAVDPIGMRKCRLSTWDDVVCDVSNRILDSVMIVCKCEADRGLMTCDLICYVYGKMFFGEDHFTDFGRIHVYQTWICHVSSMGNIIAILVVMTLIRESKEVVIDTMLHEITSIWVY